MGDCQVSAIPGFFDVASALMRRFSQEKIMEMESELLIPNLKDPRLVSLVSENIGRIADGSSSHCAGALKLGLKKGVEFKRQGKGMKLRCPRGGCARQINPVPYSSVGSTIYCLNCVNVYGNYYMQCVGCGYQRVGAYTSCQSCRKKFA